MTTSVVITNASDPNENESHIVEVTTNGYTHVLKPSESITLSIWADNDIVVKESVEQGARVIHPTAPLEGAKPRKKRSGPRKVKLDGQSE